MSELPDPVQAILAGLPEKKQSDAKQLIALLARVSGYAPRDAGSGQIGFGNYKYEYNSGRKGESYRIGLAPKKNKQTLYIVDGFEERQSIMARLGKYKSTVCCLHINKLDDIDLGVLEELVKASVATMNERYPV